MALESHTNGVHHDQHCQTRRAKAYDAEDLARLGRSNVSEAAQANREARAVVKALEEQIITTPAQGFTGLAIKLRLASDNLPPENERHADERALVAVLADAERLAQGSLTMADTSDDPVMVLEAERRRLCYEAGARAGAPFGTPGLERSEALYAAAGDVETKMFTMEPITPEGVDALLRLLNEYLEPDDKLQRCIENLRRAVRRLARGRA